jgi:hypothetical protein
MDGSVAVPIETMRSQGAAATTSGDRVVFLACATVVEEMRPLLPPGVECHVLDFGLHIKPDSLKSALQDAIDDIAPRASTIVLGYGLCSMAVVGLKSDTCTLVVPRVDDCIAIFLGSGEAYRQQARAEPGTYYLTKGWIEVADSPFDEYPQYVERWGQERARWLMEQMIGNYTRLALINTGEDDLDRYREYTRRTAAQFGLRYEEIPGSRALIEQMIHGPWDGDFVVAPPGHVISFADFRE